MLRNRRQHNISYLLMYSLVVQASESRANLENILEVCVIRWYFLLLQSRKATMVRYEYLIKAAIRRVLNRFKSQHTLPRHQTVHSASLVTTVSARGSAAASAVPRFLAAFGWAAHSGAQGNPTQAQGQGGHPAAWPQSEMIPWISYRSASCRGGSCWQRGAPHARCAQRALSLAHAVLCSWKSNTLPVFLRSQAVHTDSPCAKVPA